MNHCKHNDEINSFVGVNRLTDEAGNVVQWQADIRITCTKCGKPFRFKGLNMGLSGMEPMCSFDRDEARMPLDPPETKQVLEGEKKCKQ